jgi:molybdopterin adenylyltransferase
VIQVGILTISDRSSRGERADDSGPAIHDLVEHELGAHVAQYKIVPDDVEEIAATLARWSDELNLDLILTTGGTGFTVRDVTPEATIRVIERRAPGIEEAMRAESMKHTIHAMLSRAAAGIRGQTIIVNLPGSPKAVRQNLSVILPALPHAVRLLRGEAAESEHSAPQSQTEGEPMKEVIPVTVFVAQGQLQASVIKSRLESEGIPVVLQYESLGMVCGLTVDGLGEVKVMVPQPLEEQARAILREAEQSQDNGASTAEE